MEGRTIHFFFSRQKQNGGLRSAQIFLNRSLSSLMVHGMHPA
jgi:hypothetical protein